MWFKMTTTVSHFASTPLHTSILAQIKTILAEVFKAEKIYQKLPGISW